MEVYIDDMIVKSKEPHDHLKDLGECFDRLRYFQMKLNPTKCVFSTGSPKFFGYFITQQGIEANPDKIQAIIDMQPPSTIKDVQNLQEE